MRSLHVLESLTGPIWVQHLAVATLAASLAFRRRFPLSVGSYSAAHMFATCVAMPTLSGVFTLQIVYFLGLYSAVAYAADRQAATVLVAGVIVFMGVWLAFSYAVNQGLEDLFGPKALGGGVGLFNPSVAGGLLVFLINAMFFGGAILLGRNAWCSARHTAQVAEQTGIIAAQARRLRDQAVVGERLRIAREIHDVVAHHVSVMGVQAAAARRVLDRDPARASEALLSIEQSSRSAVEQMRGLLGTLRGSPDGAGAGTGASALGGAEGEADNVAGQTASRLAQPGLADLPALIAGARTPGLAVTLSVVDPEHNAESVPDQVGLALYRIIQESLANVRRHSTANRADVVVRVTPQWAEAEVLDNGRPRGATSGTGLGLVGVRERIAALAGTSDIGTRVTGGYRVRVRFPIAVPVAAGERQ